MAALADFGGAALTARGRYKIIVPASITTQQIAPPNLKVTDTYTDGQINVAGVVYRVCRLVVATGTGAITLYDSDTSGHCNTAHTIWGQATTVAGTVFELDMPIQLGLWISTAASTTCVVTFN